MSLTDYTKLKDGNVQLDSILNIIQKQSLNSSDSTTEEIEPQLPPEKVYAIVRQEVLKLADDGKKPSLFHPAHRVIRYVMEIWTGDTKTFVYVTQDYNELRERLTLGRDFVLPTCVDVDDFIKKEFKVYIEQ